MKPTKFAAIGAVACEIAKTLTLPMSFAELGAWLNANGYTTDRGTPFVEGGRGIGKILRATYDRARNAGQKAIADAVAKAFVNANGEYAWEVWNRLYPEAD